MKKVSLEYFNENIESCFEESTKKQEPISISSNDNEMVMMNARDYYGLLETLHLMSSPKNAERLLSVIKDCNAGKGTVRQLIE